jgi:hypothetical protein
MIYDGKDLEGSGRNVTEIKVWHEKPQSASVSTEIRREHLNNTNPEPYHYVSAINCRDSNQCPF